MVVNVLTRAGAMSQAQVVLYKAVAQAVILYGSEIWVVIGAMLKVLEGFHHRVARQIARKTYRRTVDVDW